MVASPLQNLMQSLCNHIFVNKICGSNISYQISFYITIQSFLYSCHGDIAQWQSIRLHIERSLVQVRVSPMMFFYIQSNQVLQLNRYLIFRKINYIFFFYFGIFFFLRKNIEIILAPIYCRQHLRRQTERAPKLSFSRSYFARILHFMFLHFYEALFHAS